MGHIFDFVANTADGAFAVDRRQRIVMWNQSAASILGKQPPEVLGRKCFEVIRGRDACGGTVCRPGCDVLKAAHRADLPRVMEIATETAEGKETWLSMSTVLVPSRRGELSVLVHLFREVTKRHELLHAVQTFAEVVCGVSSAASADAPPKCEPPAATVDLTKREREVIAHLAAGETTQTIAETLFVSHRTVHNHVSNVLAKLGVHSRLEAVTYCIREGIV